MNEFISTSRYVKQAFESGSLSGINNLIDLDGDGFVSQLELDQANSYCLMNTLESINPISFQHLDKFRLNSGMMLTENQQKDREDSYLLLQKLIEEDNIEKERHQIVRRHKISETNNGVPVNNSSLLDDMKHRRYLEDSELTNNN